MIIVQQLVNGVGIGAVLLLVALGLTLTFGQMGVINMAHGELIMVGAYTVYVLQQVVASPGVSLFLALPVGFVVAGLLGLLLEALLLRRLYSRPLDTLLVTWGVSLVLQQAARDVFGAPNKQTTAPGWLTGGVEVGGVTVAAARLFFLALAVAAVLALTAVLTLTPLGRRIRAVVQDRDLAATSGVATARVDRTTFFIGSGLAGVAGVALTLLGSVGPTMGTSYIVYAFLIVVAGGVGRLAGAVVMAFAVGMVSALAEFQLGGSVATVVVFVAVVAFLQWRPAGLFTLRTRSLA